MCGMCFFGLSNPTILLSYYPTIYERSLFVCLFVCNHFLRLEEGATHMIVHKIVGILLLIIYYNYNNYYSYFIYEKSLHYYYCAQNSTVSEG